MNKLRLEFLSDGVFAIVMTLLVIEIKVPEQIHALSSAELWQELLHLTPLFVAYFTSFAVLVMFWVQHNFFFQSVIKEINRALIGINMIFLSLIALIPFSSHLLGRYSEVELAVVSYGLNVLALGLVFTWMFWYANLSKEIDSHELESRIIKQGSVRRFVTIGCTLVGLGFAFVYIPLALFFYAIPVVFNTIPGLLNKAERALGFRLE